MAGVRDNVVRKPQYVIIIANSEIFEQIFNCWSSFYFKAVVHRHLYHVVLQYCRTVKITDVKNRIIIGLLALKATEKTNYLFCPFADIFYVVFP